MNTYELLVIIKPSLASDETDGVLDQIRSLLMSYKATITNEDIWGMRKLAYQIQRFGEGYYAVLTFTGASDKVSSLENALNLNENVIRYLITRV